MKTTMTLTEISDRVRNWEKFCDKKGYDYYVLKEGGGHIEVELSEEELYEFGILTK